MNPPFDYFKPDPKISIRYGNWPCRPKKPLGTVILLNGRSDYLEKYAETAGELNDRGFDVFSFDWRGQGLSTRMLPQRRKGFVERFDDYLADLVYFFEKMVRRNGPPPFIILAQSMGGLMALHFLHDHPTAIKAAILVSPMIDICMPSVFKHMTHTIAKFAVKLGRGQAFAPGASRYSIKDKTFEKNKNTSDPDRFRFDLKTVRENPKLAVGGVTYQWLAAAFDSMDKLTEFKYLREIHTPLLIMGAANDSVVSLDAQKNLAQKLPNCKYCVIHGARHEILMESDEFRSKFWRQFDSFIREEMHTNRKMD